MSPSQPIKAMVQIRRMKRETKTHEKTPPLPAVAAFQKWQISTPLDYFGYTTGEVDHMMHSQIYALLKKSGHSPAKVAEIILDARRGDKIACRWIGLAYKARDTIRASSTS